jgi:hypothetical protein
VNNIVRSNLLKQIAVVTAIVSIAVRENGTDNPETQVILGSRYRRNSDNVKSRNTEQRITWGTLLIANG